jgi:hypothetical protein
LLDVQQVIPLPGASELTVPAGFGYEPTDDSDA